MLADSILDGNKFVQRDMLLPDDFNITTEYNLWMDDIDLLPVPELTENELANLSSWQREAVDGLSGEGQRCLYDAWSSEDEQLIQGVHCNATWDGYRCWPATMANTTVVQPCPPIFEQHISNLSSHIMDMAVGHRTCTATGHWQHNGWTNYTLCVLSYMLAHTFPDGNHTEEFENQTLEDALEGIREAIILRDIYFGGYIISLLLLLVALGIFSHFRSLHCARITIHKHLIGSFVLRSVIIIIMFEPFVTGRSESYRSVDWLCKTFTALANYSTIANTAWMFVEGLFLHRRVAISVFKSNEPFFAYYIIGWGVPMPFVISWAICMYFYNPDKCWNGSFEFSHSWLITVPILAFLLVNALFLINIIRIVVTKLQANNSVEVDNKIRMAVRATAVLFPLLGMTNVLFCIEPQSGHISKVVYRITNAILQASQGIFVAVIYCFLNGEVRAAVGRKYKRCVQRRTRRRSSASRRSSAMRTMSILESFR